VTTFPRSIPLFFAHRAISSRWISGERYDSPSLSPRCEIVRYFDGYRIELIGE
jgi:hypothetical protein